MDEIPNIGLNALFGVVVVLELAKSSSAIAVDDDAGLR